jgi:hypothetical protein
MKNIIKEFRTFLSELDQKAYAKDGTMTLYHYTRPDEESLVLEPTHPKSHYSRNEFETASTPRTFFYVDPRQKERFFYSANLYRVDVPANRVYDLKNDPEGYIDKVRHPTYGLRKGVEWDDLLESIREDYDGIFYSTSNFDVVAMFHPIEVTRVPPTQQAELEA